MFKRVLIIFCAITCVIPLLQGQSTGVDRYGNNCQTDCFFINQYGGECSRVRLNRFGHLLGYPPTVTTDSAQLHGMDSISVFGTVVEDGFANVTSRGFQYSNYESFVNGTNVIVGSGLGPYRSQITNLSPNQTYYYRSFANNQYGRSYGNTLSIQTAIGDLVLGDPIRGVYSDQFSIRIPILDNGGAAVSGRICAYTDSLYTEVFSCQEITPTTYSSHTSYFTDAIPGTEYYIEAVVTNTKDTLTLHTRVSCPTDLSVRVYQGTPSSSYGCDPPEGRYYHFYASISGNDPRKEDAEILWDYNGGTSTISDTNLTIWVNEIFTLSVTASIVVGRDTIAAPNTIRVQTDGVTRTRASCSCCGEEFINTMSCDGNVTAYTWVNENNDTVATTSSVTLPRGDYTLWYTDGYGCSFSKPIHIGPHIRHCTIEGEPLPNESAHLEDGVWVLDSVKDHQNNWYIIKQYGNQCWMRQNMRCTFSPKGVDLVNSSNFFITARYYNNIYDPERSKQYGLQYTHFAAADSTWNALYPTNLGPNWRGICPEGWHIPTWEECVILTECIIHQKDSTIYISPAAVTSNTTIGTNTNIMIWLSFDCRISDPERNWSEFSMLHSGSITGAAPSYSFLLADDYGNNTAGLFRTYSSNSGVMRTSLQNTLPAFVRCLRNP